ncbi:hypothetical protein WR25_14224 isoform B [Diploscapter pachys]|uniref:Nuclear receptor domain-containing protein n=1 Tax=Diploscapter pachys TaxID=2018661 RepID=A0A2A2KT55_9BILA|nr:hypothetical protein WR25_14224 isoform B [Diploscapter pachys]
MTLMKCDVCDSPTATSLHFGAKSCKACAAFFRRTVAQNSTFKCITGENKCKIHYEKRMNCKACRYVKCIKKNMKRNKVKSQMKHKPARQSTSSSSMEPPSPVEQNNIQDEQEQIDVVNVKMYNEDEAINSASLMQYPNAGGMLEYQEVALDCNTESPQTSEEYYSDNNCGIIPTFEVIEESAIEGELRQHLKCESALNRRRKISYNCTSVKDLFDNNYCIVPFEKSQLTEFDYKTFQGFHNFEYSMHYDYACSFPGYDELSSAGKNMVYRYCLGVDIVMNSAYYTSLLGYEDGVFVSSDGKTTRMVPLPITGEEPGAAQYFQSNEEFQRYRYYFSHKLALHHLPNLFENKANLNFSSFRHLKTFRFSSKVSRKDPLSCRVLSNDEESKLLKQTNLENK